MNLRTENILFEKIKNDDEKAFEAVFHQFYGSLCIYATQILHDDEAAEEIVQDLFVRIWEKRHRIEIETSIKNYLYRSVKNLCLNHIKHNQIVLAHVSHMMADQTDEAIPDSQLDEELLQRVENAIQALPDKRQEIFRLSREKGLKYREIADQLHISVKTVETQMGLAIKTLRDTLKDCFGV